MLVAIVIVAAVALLFVIHLVAVPLAKKRAVLLRGAETYAVVGLLIVCPTLAQPWFGVLLVVQVAVAFAWRPWLVLGISRDEVNTSIIKAGRMVRLSVVATGRSFRLSTAGTARVLSPVGITHLVLFRGPRTPRIKLFQNVLRKTLQNHAFTRRVITTSNKESNVIR